jgi:hypothetical protein
MDSRQNTPICTLQGAENYHVWSLCVVARLQCHKAWHILHDQPPSKDDLKYEKYILKSELAIGVITSSLSDEILTGLLPNSSLKDLWEYLRAKYSGKSRIQSMEGTRTMVSTYFSHMEKVEVYISRMESAIRDIRAGLAKDEKIPEWFFTNILLSNLDSAVWDTFVTLILHEEKDITFRDLTARMIEHEKQWIHRESAANLVKAKKRKPVCPQCKRPGHTEENCWDLYPEKRPEKYRKKEEAQEDGAAHFVQSPFVL